MAGNVWEWVNDWYDPGYYAATPEQNPPGPENGDKKVLRGGSWYISDDQNNVEKEARTAHRNSNEPGPNDRFNGVGFRCATDFQSDATNPVATQKTPVPTPTPVPQPSSTPFAALVSDSDIWMDRTEVTNAQYNECRESGVCATPVSSYGEIFERDDHPVVGVDWVQAKTYCEWKGGRLPTKTEWQLAASPNNYQWPWGNDPEPDCNVVVIKGCNAGHTEPVGSKPAGANPDGILDLIGNVWEWTLDVDPSVDTRRFVLGGGWDNPDGTDKGGVANFNPTDPNLYLTQGTGHQRNNQGFRCVYDPVK